MTAAEDKRDSRLRLLEDDIGKKLADSHRNGELQAAPSFGKPLNFGDGYEATPAELRMPMKALKDAGIVPPEVELMQQLAALRQAAQAAQQAHDPALSQRLTRQASDLQQTIAMRLERLRGGGF